LASIVRQIGLYHFEVEENSMKNLKKLGALKEKMNLELENTVRERTKSLQEANRQLNSLIKHNNQIADELHKQREEIENKNNELERAFKKSSAQHIRLQKAMMLNVEQQNKLASSIEIIQEKNIKLEQQNEEIMSQQDKIREQNSLLEERARNITDSILYAERIQNSFFPPESKVKELFPESYIYFRPKDILSGDIYWVDTLYKDGKALKLITAIDCTGHGIPGALMSIMARDAINEAIHHKNLTDPGAIIDCLNEIIIDSLNKKSNIHHVKDGMDMAMIVVDYEENLLHYSGAKNPLYLVSNDTLHIEKGYIHSVGTVPYDDEIISFPTHTYSFKKGDIVYLFSDGFPDQFGGKNGNKFRYARFNDFLMEIRNLPPVEQYFRLDQTFTEWKGNWEQVDDVLVIGIKL
jgi:serine phosphatase RsbU (regulator of sigma subunit)